MNTKRLILSLIIALLGLSCTERVSDAGLRRPDNLSPLAIYASISGTGYVSRAELTEKDDQWSYTGFDATDIMGFYSSGGNWLGDDKSFNNLKLQFDPENKRFTDLDNGVEFNPSEMNGSQIFMYFPYDADMGETGLEMRREVNGIQRCVDLLSSNEINLSGVVDGKNVALYGTFFHTFSELIIMRGEGFDRPPTGKERITAVLRDPYTHVRVNVTATEDSWSCSPEIYFNEASGLSREDALRWEAWKGDNYGRTQERPEGTPAWYIVVPSLGCVEGPRKVSGERSYVEYIELYDNEGYLQRVSALRLSQNTKYLDGGWRYPMEITMKELVPTVNPFKIESWNQNVNLTDERERGIKDEAEFANWVYAYNTYLREPGDEQIIATLLKYGDSFIDGDNNQRSWHFYVLADLDLTHYTPLEDDNAEPIGNVIIPRLQDILDGISTTLVDSQFINHTIKGLNKTFIGEMSGDGLLQNFDFEQPEVTNDETSTQPAGILVNTLDAASVVNCNINYGTMFNPAGPAGMVAGSMKNGATVQECTLSGFLVAGSTADGEAAKIAGETDGTENLVDNDADAVTR